MEHKNDYSVIAFFDDMATKKWQFALDLNKFAKFLNKKHSSWMYKMKPEISKKDFTTAC